MPEITEERGKSQEEHIKDALKINESEIRAELIDQPSQYFYYSCGWALATRKRRLEKLALKETEAKLGRQFKELVRTEDPKARVTERMLDDWLAENEEYKRALQSLISAEYVSEMLEVAKDAFKQRSQVLIELARSDKEEKYWGDQTVLLEKEMMRRDEKIKRTRKPKEELNKEE